MRVVFSDDAFADLQSIGDEIAKHNPERAATYIEEIITACEGLGQHPERHQIRPKFGKAVRRLNFGAYGIFYRIFGEDTVQISRILHGKRRIRRTMMV